MNKELRNGLEIAANYYYLREEALIELTLKEQQYEKKKKYYEDTLRSSKKNAMTIWGAIILGIGIIFLLIATPIMINYFSKYGLKYLFTRDTVLCILLVGVCFLGAKLAFSAKKRKKQVEERAQKIWDEEVLLAEKEYNDQLETAKAIINPLDEMYREFVEDIIPPSYRCYSDAFALYDLVANGRADSMKEAINLYEVIKREERKMQEFEYAMSRYESTTREMILNQAITNIQLSQIRDDIRRNS